MNKFRRQILELKADGKDYSAQLLFKGQNKEVISKTLGDFYKKLLDDMEQSDQYGNWRFYKRFSVFFKDLTLVFMTLLYLILTFKNIPKVGY